MDFSITENKKLIHMNLCNYALRSYCLSSFNVVSNKNIHKYLNCIKLDCLHIIQLKQIAADNAEVDMRMQNSSVKYNSETCKCAIFLTKLFCVGKYSYFL